MENGSLPASPCNELLDDDVIAQRVALGGSDVGFIDHLGLTKRERFAMAAMQGSLASDVTNESDVETIAEWAVEAADALLKKLEEE